MGPTITGNALVAPNTPPGGGTAAGGIGYTPLGAPGSFFPSSPAKPVASVSTEQGQNVLQKTIAQATKLGGTTPVVTKPAAPAADTATKTATDTQAPTDASKTAAPTATKITLINPQTEQKVTFENPDLNKDSIKSFMAQGYQMAEASGAVPTWLNPTGVSAPTNTNALLDASTAAVTQAKSDLAAAVGKLQNFDVSQDPQLQKLLAGITSTWDTRISDLTQSENSHIAALTTTGMRIGSQYTGGAGGMTGSIVSAEEQAALKAIGDLRTQKDQALAAAQSAFETQKWGRYNDLVQIAQKAYDGQLTQLQKLQEAQATQDQKLQDMQRVASVSAGVAKLYAAGTTNPADILAAMRKGGDTTTTLEDINKSITSLTPAGIPDLVKTATGNGAPASVIQSILKASDLSAAYGAAGDFAAGGTGMVGEYNFYKAQATAAGQKPVDFNTYQTMDANRKASATAAANAKYTFDFSNPTDASSPGVLGQGKNGDILSATGLSYNGFLALTGQMSLLPRDQVTRNKASAEVAAFAKARGVDVATLVPQIEAAWNNVKNNVAKENNVNVTGQDLSATVDQFAGDFNPKDVKQGFFGLGSNALTIQNITDLVAGKQVNSPLALKYGADIAAMGNDLATYYAASRTVGANGAVPNPTDAEMNRAANIVYNGMNTGSAAGLKEFIDENTQKIAHVVKSAADTQRQNIWELTGVGAQYKPLLTSTDLMAREKQATNAITAYVKTNPGQADAMAKAADAVNPKTGQTYTASEIAQIYGIDTTK